jgi:hypothetical protein
MILTALSKILFGFCDKLFTSILTSLIPAGKWCNETSAGHRAWYRISTIIQMTENLSLKRVFKMKSTMKVERRAGGLSGQHRAGPAPLRSVAIAAVHAVEKIPSDSRQAKRRRFQLAILFLFDKKPFPPAQETDRCELRAQFHLADITSYIFPLLLA